ncbi:LCP family protein [Paenibacillus aceti]|uniref:Transcriptional regulator YvhJ n=1 Tax=Paenibacillus aceti TaxID=1820010 RepID=A0ABQ1VN12_9BACL|nr:LCP family protein [Paenibacillus aceti]GGF82937.1 putative transcriptional regulator YvhJ [Paenibacillus aceti]
MSSYNKGLPPRDDRSRRPSAKGSKKHKKRSGGKSFFKLLMTILIIAVLGAGGVGGYLLLTLNDTINKTGTSGKVAPENSAKVKPLAMLLLGTDYRPKTGTHLSDVIMVVAMNPKTKSATIVSLPRDTRFQMKGYKTNKLNAFYPKFLVAEKKSGISAKQEMKTMLSKYMDIPLDYTTVLNFQGFRDVVDALGGVDVTVDADMCYKDNADGTNIDLKKGPQHLNGEKALDFVRYRKSNCKTKTKPSNDFERNQRQNEVLHALIDQTKSLNGVMGAGKAIESLGDNMTTDLEAEQIKNVIAAYWNISKENVAFIPVTGEWKSPYVYIDDSELNKAKQALKDELAGIPQANGQAE